VKSTTLRTRAEALLSGGWLIEITRSVSTDNDYDSSAVFAEVRKDAPTPVQLATLLMHHAEDLGQAGDFEFSLTWKEGQP
jgi:hypothetical protein